VLEPDLPLLDDVALAELAASVGGDTAFVVDLIGTYLGDAPRQIAEIQAAAEAHDAAALVRPAHTLKSSSATVGAQRLSARARRLENAGREDALDAAAGDLAGLAAEWEGTLQALRGWMDRSS
jgi:HPt (histidine-containing phosphotransfer) domain-containing protein